MLLGNYKKTHWDLLLVLSSAGGVGSQRPAVHPVEISSWILVADGVSTTLPNGCLILECWGKGICCFPTENVGMERGSGI